MTVPNFMSKEFSYQDLRRGSLCGAWSDNNTPGQIGLLYSDGRSSYEETLEKNESASVSHTFMIHYRNIQVLCNGTFMEL